MLLKRIRAMLLASCMLVSMAGCGTAESKGSGSGSGASMAGMPTLKQIYAANTLEQYEKAGIQPSFSSCLREGKENKESNALMTLYFDEELGLVCRFRKTETGLNFRYYFNRDDVNYYAQTVTDEQTQKEIVTLTIEDNPENSKDEMTNVEKLLRQYSFGEYNGKEKIISTTDCGETYHIVTDVSYASFTDNSGSTYEYTTQEYDVEKETLRILDTFRTYTFTNSSGESKTCTLSRSLTYGEKIFSMPEFMINQIRDAEWDQEFTIRSYERTRTVPVPDGVLVNVDVPSDYAVYTDSSQKELYEANASAESAYIGEK